MSGDDLVAIAIGALVYMVGLLFDSRALVYVGAGMVSAFIGILMMDLGDGWRL